MAKIFLIVLSLVISIPSFACSVPRMGPEYDSLITVERGENNTFKAVVPKSVGDLDFGVEIVAAYYREGNENRHAEYFKNIHPQIVDTNYIAIFSLKNIEGYTPYIRVYWYPEIGGLCGAYGRSSDLYVK